MKNMLTAAIAAVLVLGVGAASPAEAKDSGWGCGGACRTINR